MTAQDHPHASLSPTLLGPLLRQVGRKVQGSVEARFGAADINYTQWRMLFAIRGSQSPDDKALAVELAVSPGSVSRIVNGLEARGLVSRRRSSADCHAARLIVTPKGLAKLREVAPVIDRRLTDALAGLRNGEIDILMQFLGRLATSLDGHAARLADKPVEA